MQNYSDLGNDSNDLFFMLKAITVGEKARILAPPNPWVGCVLVNHGKIISEGCSEQAGGRHAEIVAIQNAQGNTRGCTAYVSLEPCAHIGRTPPCVDALIRAEISRVVIALTDPDPRVNGLGVTALRQAGIDVTIGTAADKAAISLAPYLHQRRTKRPYVAIKTALSIDGRSAAADSSSQWISSHEARCDAHQLRAESQAILIGSGTALKDNPQLTVRSGDSLLARQPLRVIVDSRGRLRPPLHLFETEKAATLIATSKDCRKEIQAVWRTYGAEVALLPICPSGQGVDLHALLTLLGERGIIQVLVEGGSTLQTSLLEANLWNRLVIYLGACILGSNGLPAFGSLPIANIREALPAKLVDICRKGNSVRIDYLSIQ